MRNIPGTILYFYCYESIRGKLHKPETQMDPKHVLLAGGISGTLYWVALYPVDVVGDKPNGID